MNIIKCSKEEYAVLEGVVKACTTIDGVTYYGYITEDEFQEILNNLSDVNKALHIKRSLIISLQQSIRTYLNPASMEKTTKVEKIQEEYKQKVIERFLAEGWTQSEIDTFFAKLN